MKIAQLISQFYPHTGGAEICVHNVCRNLVKAGHQAVVVTTTPPPEVRPDLPYEIEYLWDKTGGLFRNLPYCVGKIYLEHGISKLQKKHKFELWQVTNGWPYGVFSVQYFNEKKIPCVLRCCGEDIQKFPQINYGMRLDPAIDGLVAEKYPLFDGLVALTQSVKNEYLKLGIQESKIKIIPNGVEFAKFAEVKEERRLKIRQDLGLAEGETLILTVGRYHPKKGYDLIPEIAGILKAKGIRFKWVVCGRGSSELCKDRTRSDSLGLVPVERYSSSKSEIFSLPSQELVELYCSADIFAFPTLIETFGMVLVEAMAAGLPIVTTEAEGVKDVVENEVNGLKTEPGNSAKFADLLYSVIESRPLGEKLRAASLESARKYDWSLVAHAYMDFYAELMGAKR